MKLVSVTLTGNNQNVIVGALSSVVNEVDNCIIIDTGVTDDSLQLAKKIAKDKYIEKKFVWSDNFSEARNFSLKAAQEEKADWVIIVDTDERIITKNLKIQIAQAQEDIFLLFYKDGNYAKEKLFRVPVKGHFVGPTHEYFDKTPDAKKNVFYGAKFDELFKTPEQYLAKFQRDEKILKEWISSHPKESRWYYYLGDSLQNMGKTEQAIEAYTNCFNLRGWREESAWACYRCAKCYIALNKYSEAVETCAFGLSRHAGVAELAWMAAYASFQMAEIEQSVYWARMAIPMGCFMGHGNETKRINFRNWPALYEGPFDVLRFALKMLGDVEGAARAEELFKQAEQKRKQLGY